MTNVLLSFFFCRTMPDPNIQYGQMASFNAAGNHMARMDALLRENEKLRRELETYSEKAVRIQKVRTI